MVSKIAYACICLPTPIAEEGSTDGYEVVFKGELIEINRTEIHFEETNDTFPVEINSYAIEKSFKGATMVGDTLEIYQFGIGCTNGRGLTDLNSSFIIGAFRHKAAHEDWPDLSEFLQANLCSLSISENDEPSYSDGISILLERSELAFRKDFQDKFAIPLVVLLATCITVFTMFFLRSDLK